MRTAEFGGDLQRQIHGRSGIGLEPPLTIVETFKAEPRSVHRQCRLECEIEGFLQQGESFKNRVEHDGFAFEHSGEGDIDFRRSLGLTDLPVEILRLLIGFHCTIQIAGRRSTSPDRPQTGGLAVFRMIYVLGTPEHIQSSSEMVGEYRLIQVDQTDADSLHAVGADSLDLNSISFVNTLIQQGQRLLETV